MESRRVPTELLMLFGEHGEKCTIPACPSPTPASLDPGEEGTAWTPSPVHPDPSDRQGRIHGGDLFWPLPLLRF